MAAYELDGTIKAIFETMTFPSGFTKRDFVVTTNDRYPQNIKLECVKERTSMLDSFKEGDEVKVDFDLRGNEHNEKFFVNLQAWRIESTSEGSQDDNLPPSPTDAAAPGENPDDDDDLPF